MEDYSQIIFILVMLVVGFLQWLFKTLKGGDEPAQNPREEMKRRAQQHPESEVEQRKRDEEQEAYRRLMEALGVPVEDQEPHPAHRETPEPTPAPVPPPQPQRQWEPQPQQRQTPPPPPVREEESQDNPYLSQSRSWRDQTRQQKADIAKAENEAEQIRRSARTQRPAIAISEMDAEVLKKTEIGVEEIGTGLEIGQIEKEFSWENSSPSPMSGGFTGMTAGSSASAYSIRADGPVRRVSRAETLEMLSSRENLKKAIILREILGPPKAFQDQAEELYHQNL